MSLGSDARLSVLLNVILAVGLACFSSLPLISRFIFVGVDDIVIMLPHLNFADFMCTSIASVVRCWMVFKCETDPGRFGNLMEATCKPMFLALWLFFDDFSLNFPINSVAWRRESDAGLIFFLFCPRSVTTLTLSARWSGRCAMLNTKFCLVLRVYGLAS